MGESYIQFVVKNILKVHNRNHPKKRRYVAGEDKDKMTHFKRSTQTWYQRLNNISKTNLDKTYHTQEKFQTYLDLKRD